MGGTYGGLSPGFERYGGGRVDILKTILDGMIQQRGTAQDSTTDSNVYPENMAIARVLAELWSNNQRLANQWDVKRMTVFIPRWEEILGIVPNEGDTDTVRRARIAIAFGRIAQSGIYQVVYDQLVSQLGSVFVGLVNQSSSTAVVWTPSGWDVGSHDPSQQINFYSTIAHLSVEVKQLPYMTDGEFYETVGGINPILDDLLPAWVTWDWFRTPSGVPGFYLDSGWPGGAVPAGEPSVNLDNEVLNP